MIDIVKIFTNLVESLGPVQAMLSGFGYIVGVGFVLASLTRFHKAADTQTQSSSQEKMFVPILYLVMGVGLIFLPTTLNTMANTAFGVGNILSYSEDTEDKLVGAIKFLIETTGIIWFVRGSILLTHASHPGVQEGPKGLTFLVAGVFAMNFDNTVHVVDYMLANFFTVMSSTKSIATG
jgi:hypothetical protein